MKKFIYGLIGALLIAYTVGAQPEFYTDAYLGLPEFRALPVRLPGSHPDSVQVEVHVRIVYDDLQFVKKGDDYISKYSVDVAFRDKADQLLGSSHIDRTISVASYSETNSRIKGDQSQFQFSLPHGSYVMRIDVQDRETRKIRTLERDFGLDARQWDRELQLGEIVLIDSTGQAVLSSGILQGPPVRVSYRLYSEVSDSLFLDYQLRNDRDKVALAGTVELKGSGPLYVDTLSIPTDSLRDARYEFFLMARQGITKVMRSYPFDLLLKNLPSYIYNLDMAIMQLKYIAADDEYRHLVRTHGQKREELFRDFWKQRDPTPSTPTNEKMDEYYRRVHYANEHFTGYRGGWESDMGQVYVIFGPPNDIERHPFDLSQKPYEIWYYYDINRKFIFQDQEGFGDYRLISPLWSDY
jgi:GWxTD domain-containing protein